MEQLLERFSKAPMAVKLGGVLGLLIVVSLINFFFFVQPAEDQLTSNTDQLRSLERQYAEKKEIADNLNERRRDMAVLEEKLQQALTELPEQADLQELLAQLNDISRKAGLELQKIEPGTEVPADFFSKIPLKMNVRGNYHEIAMFMQEVSKLRRIVNVNNIKLTEEGTRNDKVMLNAEFLATTFRFLDAAAQKAAKEGAAK